MVNPDPVLVAEHHDEEQEDDEVETSSGSKIAAIFQKPFDFISMMVQFIIYFMVRMATEGCMLPIPELEGNDNQEDEEEEEAAGSSKKNQ